MDKDAWSGYHPFIDEDGCEYGSFEVFWHDAQEDLETGEGWGEGWFWWACFPGCLPDGMPLGPFDSSYEAFNDATEDYYASLVAA